MDPFTPPLLKAGIKVTIGKGRRSQAVKEAMKNQFHATLLEMSKKAEACTYCQGIFVRAAALT